MLRSGDLAIETLESESFEALCYEKLINFRNN